MADKDRSGREFVFLPVLFLGAGIYLYANLFRWPNIPFLLSGDQVFFWVYTQRMLLGEHIYRDFFEFTPPGTDLFYLSLFKFFGTHVWVTNLAVMILGLALCGVCFSIARRLMALRPALLASFLFLVFVYGRALNATHHWFSLLAVLCAVRIVMPARTPIRVTLAGALLGIASCFTQTAGVAALLAFILSFAWEMLSAGKPRTEKPRTGFFGNQILLAAVFCLTLLVLNLALVRSVGWQRLWYDEVVYPRQYLAYWFGKWFPGLPWPLSLHNLLRLAPYLAIYALLPVIYPVALIYCWRNRRNPDFPCETELVLQASTGLFLMLEILPGINWLRVFCVAMPALILLVWAATRASRWNSCFIFGGWALIVCMALGNSWSRHARNQVMMMLPSGKASVPAQEADKFLWLQQHTTPGDYLFQAGWPEVYLPLGLRSPVFLDTLIPNDETRPEFVDLAIRQLERRQVKYILWSPRLNRPDNPQRPWQDHLEPMRAFLRNHYRRVQVFNDLDEIWQRDGIT